MDVWQRNMRMMHQISEFLDLDSAESNKVSDFISLIQAMREGLTNINDEFRIPDSQINTLFLTKLKSRPEWEDWAMNMLRDSRLYAANPATRMSFQELGDLAMKHEKTIRGEGVRKEVVQKGNREDVRGEEIRGPDIRGPDTRGPDVRGLEIRGLDIRKHDIRPDIRREHIRGEERHQTTRGIFHEEAPAPPPKPPKAPPALTQEEINAFVVKQMNRDDARAAKHPGRRHTVRGHSKKPSQEEINDYVVQQMRREHEHRSRNRSHSQPEPRMQNPPPKPVSKRCSDCGGSHHQSSNCWRRYRVGVEVPKGNYVPKRVEYRTEVPGQPPKYRTGFTIN